MKIRKWQRKQIGRIRGITKRARKDQAAAVSLNEAAGAEVTAAVLDGIAVGFIAAFDG